MVFLKRKIKVMWLPVQISLSPYCNSFCLFVEFFLTLVFVKEQNSE